MTRVETFGFYARGEQTEQSDVDVSIDYVQAPPLVHVVELLNAIADIKAFTAGVYFAAF